MYWSETDGSRPETGHFHIWVFASHTLILLVNSFKDASQYCLSYDFMMSEPIEATKIFWESLVDGDFESINRFLSPDCRLQDSFDEHARGLAGNVKCLEKLKDVRQKIVSNRLNSTMKSTALMRNEKEVRFMISDKIGFISVTIGFALEWVHNIVTHIVIIKNVSESVFMVDNTKEMIPQPISVEPDNTAAVVHETSGDAQDQSSVERSPIEDLSEQTPAKSCDSPSGGKWYPGKYAKKVRSKSKEICHPSEQSNIGDMGMELTWESYFESVLGRTLTPPYLVPRPPPIPPTITVTVHRAVGLVSRMKRVVSRPINSYVEITVFDRVRSTPVVRMNANPVYDSTNGLNKFIFEIPNLPHFNATNGILHVDVKDTHMVAQEDILACVDIPFASIKTTSGQTAATELCYPLHLMEKNADILPRLHVSRKVRHPHTIATPVAVEGDGKAPVELRGSPCIFLSINKVDIMSWWVLEEQRMRDKKRKEAAAEEKMRAKLASPKKAALKSHQSKKNEEEKRRRRDPSVDQLREQRDHWVDDDEVTHCPR